MKKALFQRALCLLLTLSTLLTGLGFTAGAGSLKDADLEDGEESIYTTLEEMKALVGTSSYSDYIDDYVWELNNQTGLVAPTVDLIGGMYADVSSGVIVSESELCEKVAISEAFLANKATSADKSVYLPAQGYTTWNFHVSAEQAGLYYIKFTYFTANTSESSISTIERKLKIDGKIPYDEVAALVWTKEWKFNNKELISVEDTNEEDGSKTWYEYPDPAKEGSLYKKFVATVKDGKKTTVCYTLTQDINGNTMSAETVQEPAWNTYYCQDSTGYEQGYLLFYLEEGERSITLEAEREPVILSAIELIPYDKNSSEIPSYADIKNSYTENGYTAPQGGTIVDIQAEFPDYVSDASVSVSNDNTSAVTTPVSSQAQQFNVIGETGYNTVGQWAAYKFSVDKTGLYNFSMRFKQNALEGMYICRTLKLSGGHYGSSATVPFAEAYNAQFNYSKDWQSAYVSDNSGEAFQFYFEAGVEYTVYLECSLGTLKSLIKRVEDVLNAANSSYLRILQYTGPSPDKARQYNFDLIMMDVLVGFMAQAKELMDVKAELENLCGGTTGAHTATLETVAILLDTMGRDKGEKIAENMSNLKSYLGTLGTWINSSKQSSMMVDSIYVVPVGTGDDGLARAEAGFFKSVWFEFLSFIFSFFTDYEAMGLTKKIDENTPKIDVWLATGRDQSQIWRSMIDANDGFTNTTGTAASLKLVTAGTLLPSILSGKGPDVYIGLGSADVINYAIRDAVVGISGNAKAETDEQKQANSYFANTYYTYRDSEGNYEHSMQYDAARANQISFVSRPYSEVTTPDEYSPAAMKTITLLDVSYGLPSTMGFAMMFYRMDSLANLGLEIPESWGQLLAALPVLQTNNMEIGVTYISA
ncbi:MAG: hypothetical protein IIX96_00310, partial [Clostridia bacterium]|nr:hypothetical protein [Clostridia bacterium]